MGKKEKVLACDYCKHEYLVDNYAYNLIILGKQSSHCCSKECSDKLKVVISAEKRRNFPIMICDWCGQEFRVQPYMYKKKMKNELFIACGRDCAQKLMGKFHRDKNNVKYTERITVSCDYCKKDYEIYPNKIDSSKYCSKECMGLAKTRDATVILVCQYCGKDFDETRGQINFFGETKYCSSECRNLGSQKRATLYCSICQKEYWVPQSRSEKSVCCSTECLAKWNSQVYSQRPEVKLRLRKQGLKSQLNAKTSYTLPELIVYSYLEENNIAFIPQYVVGEILVVDFFLPDYNCVLEVYGDYWHANPLKYGESPKIPLSEMQIRNKQKDIRRYKVLTKKYDYYFYSLWETNIKKDLDNSMNKFFKYINSKIRRESDVLQ